MIDSIFPLGFFQGGVFESFREGEIGVYFEF